jgi:hypothetical protein
MTVFRCRLPWLCGCHDPEVFGHLLPCAWWETDTAQPWKFGWELTR